MRQGNDVGTQYRSGIYHGRCGAASAPPTPRAPPTSSACAPPATATITTEILPAPEFYYAEEYHQQYLAKNPGGYCGLGGTGVACQVGVDA